MDLRDVVFRPAGTFNTPAGLDGGDAMEVKTGVYTAAEVNAPVNGGGPVKWLDGQSPATWATIWFVVAVVFLLKVL